MKELREDIRDLASDPTNVNKFVLIRVDLLEDSEVGTVIGVGDDRGDLRKIRQEDLESKNAGGEYFIFSPIDSSGMRRSEWLANPSAPQGWKVAVNK